MTMASPVGSRPAYLDSLYRDTNTSPSTSTSTSTSSSYRDAHYKYPLHSHSSSLSTISTTSSYSLRSPPSEQCNSDSVSIRSKTSLSFLSSPKKRFEYILQRHRHTFPQTTDELYRSGSVSSIYSQPPTPPSSSSPSTPILEENEDEEKPAEVEEESVVVAPPTRRPPRPPRPSLPRLQTTFASPNFGPPAHVLAYERKALPAIPRTQKPAAAAAPLRNAPLRRQASRSQPPPATRRYYAPVYDEGIDHVSVTTDLGCQRCYYFVARNCNGYILGGNSGDACDTCLSAGFFGAS